MATAGNTVNKLQKFAYSTANNTMVHNTDVVVQGNLTVRGTQTYAQTQTLLVQDNIITLNAAVNQSGVPLFDAGIEIDRGQEQNVSLLWKESEGAWKFTNDGTNYETLGGGSAGTYANAAFLQANAAFASANNVAPQVQPAFDKANSAGLYANAAFIKANAAYAFANSTTAWGTRQTFVATAGQTVFNVGSGYLVGYIDVYYNGIKLYGGDDYTASDGLSVTLTNPALVNDIIEVVGFGANVPVANIYVLNSTTSFVNRQTFFATANQTTFTPTQSYRVGFIDVYYNGLKMVIPDDVVANNGTTIEFIGLTPTTNDVIEIVGLTPNVALANAIPITGGSVSGNLLPAATNTYYLGSSTNRWHSLFLGPASLDIDGLILSNSGGTLAVTSSAGAPSTFIDTYARGHSNAAFQSANNVAPQVQPAFDKANAAFNAANSVNVYGANTNVTSFFAIPQGNTAQRPANPQLGSIRYNTTSNTGEIYVANGWVVFGQQLPSISTVFPTSYNGESGTQFTINGQNFTPDAQIYFIDANNISYTASIITYSSQGVILATTPQDFTVAQGPLDVKLVQQSGTYTLLDCITTGNTPSWVTASGTLVNSYSSLLTGQTTTISATDADSNSTISYSLISNPDFVSVNSSTGVFYSNTTFGSYSPSTTYNFTGRVTDNAGNFVDRSFNVIVRAPEFYSDGNDGNLVIGAGTTFFTASNTSGGRAYADGIVQKTSGQLSSGATTITLDSTVLGLAANDLIMVTAIRGNTTNYSDVGKYEFLYVDSVSTNTITLKSALQNSYVSTDGIIVQRIPKYFNVYIDGTLTTNPYDGLSSSTTANGRYVSGIVAVSCRNVLQVNASGSITATGLGYRGGVGTSVSGLVGRGESYGGDTYRTSATPSGERQFLGGGGSGWHSPGNWSGAGGGGAYGSPGEAGYTDNAPGSGPAGSTYGSNTLTTMYLGSGGGGGSENPSTATGFGGAGGGIVTLFCRTLTNNGSITAGGAAGSSGGAGSGSSDGGGSGSGGSVYIRAGTASIGTCTALGGNRGGGTLGGTNSSGGYGGGGRVAVYYKTSLTGSVPSGSAQQPTYYNTTYS